MQFFVTELAGLTHGHKHALAGLSHGHVHATAEAREIKLLVPRQSGDLNPTPSYSLPENKSAKKAKPAATASFAKDTAKKTGKSERTDLVDNNNSDVNKVRPYGNREGVDGAIINFFCE